MGNKGLLLVIFVCSTCPEPDPL